MNNNNEINLILNKVIDSIEKLEFVNSIIYNLLDNVFINSHKYNKYGCEHYKRKCKLIMPCCNKAFSCRLCHDTEMYDNNNDFKKAHKLGDNRFKIKEVVCENCNTRQKKNKKCIKCGLIFGYYFCDICNLFDDVDKKQFHCSKCGFCRVGGKENFKHCDKCNLCININIEHNCSKLGNCPICLEDLQSSRKSLFFLKCNHTLHYECFSEYIKSNYKCPLCLKSMVDMTNYFNNLENEINNTPLPDEYQDKYVNIICNDCHVKSSSKFHFIGIKCNNCSSYNTKQIKN